MKILISILIGINLFCLTFAQDIIEGRWHLVGYEDNVMYQFEDNYRYSIYSEDGTFGSIEDEGGTPNPYTVVEDIITIDLFFGNIVNYQMNYICDGQVVEFEDTLYETIHSILFREGYNYIDNECEEIEFLECTEMNQTECYQGDGCDWVEDIEIANCYNLSWSEQECLSNGCSYNCTSYYGCWCSGEYEINNSFCEEVNFMPGDANNDGSLNILDIVLMVNMILGDEYDSLADINEDDIVDILDIVSLVNIILNGDTSTVTDIDGNIYETVQIGDQLWMAENLKVSRYRNGNDITTGLEAFEWIGANAGAYSVYDNDSYNAEVYGNLYNWYAADDDRGICPDGWHVPSDTEFMELEMFLGMSESEANSTGSRGINEGSKLSGRADLWNSGSLEENIEFGTSGFTGLPAGNRDYYNAHYNSMGFFGAFWSSTELNSLTAWNRELEYHASVVYRFNATKQFGFSIRCLKD